MVLNGGDPDDWHTWRKHDVMFTSWKCPHWESACWKSYLASSMHSHAGVIPHWRMNVYPFDFPEEKSAWIVHAPGWGERKSVCLDWTLEKLREIDLSYPEGDHRYSGQYQNCCKECGPKGPPKRKKRKRRKGKRGKKLSVSFSFST